MQHVAVHVQEDLQGASPAKAQTASSQRRATADSIVRQIASVTEVAENP